MVRDPAAHGNSLPIDHASVGVVVNLDRVGHHFCVATVCFDWVVRAWKCDADDLEPVVDDAETDYDRNYTRAWASTDAFEEERRRRIRDLGRLDKAYIFHNEDLEDRVREIERPANARRSVAAMELERMDDDVRGGSITVAHNALLELARRRKRVEVSGEAGEYPPGDRLPPAPMFVTPPPSEASDDPLDIVDAGFLIDYVFGEADEAIEYAKGELYAVDDDEDDIGAPHLTESMFPEDGLETGAPEIGPFPGEPFGRDTYNSFNRPVKSDFGKARVEDLGDINRGTLGPHATDSVAWVCADPDFEVEKPETGWDGDLTEAMMFRVPYVDVDVALPDLPDRIHIPAFRLPDVPSFMLNMPKLRVPDLDFPGIRVPEIPVPSFVPRFHDFDMVPEVERPHMPHMPKVPVPHDREFWDPASEARAMRDARDSLAGLFKSKKKKQGAHRDEEEAAAVHSSPPVEATMEFDSDDDGRVRFDTHRHDPETNEDLEHLEKVQERTYRGNAREAHHVFTMDGRGFAEAKGDELSPEDLAGDLHADATAAFEVRAPRPRLETRARPVLQRGPTHITREPPEKRRRPLPQALGEAAGVYAKERYAGPVAAKVGELPTHHHHHRKKHANTFERPDLKHREFKRAQKRATMLAFDELSYDPEKKGQFGRVLGKNN